MEKRTKRTLKKLRVRRRQLEQELENALLENLYPSNIAQYNGTLEAIKNIEKKYIQPKIRVILFLSFLVFTVTSLVGIAIYYKIPTATIQLEANVTEMTFNVAQSGALGALEEYPMYSIAPFEVNQFSIESTSTQNVAKNFKQGRLRIQQIEVHRGTRIRLWYEEQNCTALEILSPRVNENISGIVVHVGASATDHSNKIIPRQHYIGNGDILRFCAPPALGGFLIGETNALALTRIYHEENPRLEMSSIVSGTVAISGISETRKLSANDRLILNDLDQSWLVVRRDTNKFHLALYSKTNTAQVMNNAPFNSDGEDLIPNLLAFVTQSPAVMILSLLAGLLGVFWHATKFLLG